MNSILIRKGDIDLSTNSAVQSVTIFSDRAEVKRSMRVTIAPGGGTFVFENLGTGIDPQSIRATVTSGDARILSTSHETNHLYFYKQDEDEKTHARILDVLRRICELSDEKIVLAVENRTLVDLLDYVKRLLNAMILTQENAIPRLREALDYCNALMNDNVKRVLATRDELAGLEDEFALLTEALEKIRSLDSREQNNIRVVLASEAGGDIDVAIIYAIRGASWKTSYDLHADTGAGTVELSCYGEIRQSTGEMWSGASVLLSTSVTDNEMEIPSVYPVYLSGYEEKRSKELVVDERVRKSLTGDGDALHDEEPVTVPAPGQSGDLPSVDEERTMTARRGTATVFEIKEPVDLPPDGLWHRGLIVRATIPVRFGYESVPERAEFVYLKARFANPFEHPVLPGKSFIYRNASYMGTSSVGHVAPKEELSVSFGVDDDIRIRRIIVGDRSGPARGLANKNVREWEFHYILSNYSAKAEQVRLCEGIYVSELKEVDVTVHDDTTAGYSCDADGIVSWDVALSADPYERVKLVLRYAVRAPKEFDLGRL